MIEETYRTLSCLMNLHPELLWQKPTVFLSEALKEVIRRAEIPVLSSAAYLLEADGRYSLTVSDSNNQSYRKKIAPLVTALFTAFLTNDQNRSYYLADHSQDSQALSELQCRSSLIVKGKIEGAVILVWLGFSNEKSVSSANIEKAKELADVVIAWLCDHKNLFAFVKNQKQAEISNKDSYGKALSLLHDFKAPVTSLIATMQNESLSSESIERVRSEVVYLEYLSRASNPTADLIFAEFLLSALVKETVRSILARSSNRNKTVEFVESGENLNVVGDVVSTKRILTNLIDNAIKHSSGDHIQVNLFSEGSSAVCEVIDNGDGVSIELAQAINLGAAMPLNLPALSENQGWGVGLRAVQSLIREMNGSIHATTPRMPGELKSLIRITLPLCKSSESSKSEISFSESVIVVDDDAEQALGLVRVLVKKGVKAHAFTSIVETVAHLSGQQDQAVSIFCDADMSDGGVDTLLAELKNKNLKCRVAVLSGDVTALNQYRWAASGAEAFFPKPPSLPSITEWLSR